MECLLGMKLEVIGEVSKDGRYPKHLVKMMVKMMVKMVKKMVKNPIEFYDRLHYI